MIQLLNTGITYDVSMTARIFFTLPNRAFHGVSRAFQGCSRGVPVGFRKIPVVFNGFQGRFRGVQEEFRVLRGSQEYFKAFQEAQEQPTGFQGISGSFHECSWGLSGSHGFPGEFQGLLKAYFSSVVFASNQIFSAIFASSHV